MADAPEDLLAQKRPLDPLPGDEEFPSAKKPKHEEAEPALQAEQPDNTTSTTSEDKSTSLFDFPPPLPGDGNITQESSQALGRILNAPIDAPLPTSVPMHTIPSIPFMEPPSIGIPSLRPGFDTPPIIPPLNQIAMDTVESRFMKFGDELLSGRYEEAWQAIQEIQKHHPNDLYYYGAVLLLYRYYPAIVAKHIVTIDIDRNKATLKELQTKLQPSFKDKLASLQGLSMRHNAAKALLALCYLFVGTGLGDPHQETVETAQGLQLLHQLVGIRNPLALTTLGWFSESGMYVPKNLNKATELYQQAAAMNYSEALYQLGVVYDTGKSRDSRKAIEYYALAAQQGNAEALYNLGVCYQSGDSLELDYHKAVEYYTQAAIQGHARAQCNLGVCYETEIGLAKDLAKAVHFYELAAAQGNSEALCNLGVCYQDGDGVPVNLPKAMEYYQAAANQGNSEAQFNLGELYFNGDGVVIPKNVRKATALYLLAANAGNANAQFKLGMCYLEGEGVPLDRSQAIDYFVSASEQSHPEAEAILRQLFVNQTPPSAAPALPGRY